MIQKRFLAVFLLMHMVLGTWKGYVALFREGQEEPWQFFPTPVSSLPPEDQRSLENGILVRNEQALQQLLEDFLS